MRLDRFDNSGFDRGRPRWVEAIWRLLEGLLLNSWLPGSGWRVVLLEMFGAEIGHGVVIKPYLRVKFPWKLELGNHSWIGESVWIDNLAEVHIGSHSCISQGVYLCTGNHRWDRESFDLKAQPIEIGHGCWIGAFAKVGPGVKIGDKAVLAMGSVASSDLRAGYVYGGHPAVSLRARPVIHEVDVDQFK